MRDVVIFISEWWFAGVAFIAGWVACTALNHYLWWRERRAEAAEWTARPKPETRRIEYADEVRILADPDAQKRLELAIFRNADGANPRHLDECIKAASELRDFRDETRSGIRSLAKQTKAI